MKIKLTAEIRKLMRQELAREGGKARAKKYSRATLSKWAKLGGRPRKNASAKTTKRSSQRSARGRQ